MNIDNKNIVKLNLKKDIIAFDMNLGCSGFIYALRMASSLIESKQVKNGLIICADTYTKYISKNNTACRPIFSDAASAILVSKSIKNKIILSKLHNKILIYYSLIHINTKGDFTYIRKDISLA